MNSYVFNTNSPKCKIIMNYHESTLDFLEFGLQFGLWKFGRKKERKGLKLCYNE